MRVFGVWKTVLLCYDICICFLRKTVKNQMSDPEINMWPEWCVKIVIYPYQKKKSLQNMDVTYGEQKVQQ